VSDALRVGERVTYEVEDVFREAQESGVITDKAFKWLTDRVIPMVEELEQDADVLAEMVESEGRDT
jgi:hypothetical protein